MLGLKSDAKNARVEVAPWQRGVKLSYSTGKNPTGKKRAKNRLVLRSSNGIRQRPNLPGRFQPGTVSVLRLNFCVRDGNRWVPQAIATGNLSRLRFPRSERLPLFPSSFSPPDFLLAFPSAPSVRSSFRLPLFLASAFRSPFLLLFALPALRSPSKLHRSSLLRGPLLSLPLSPLPQFLLPLSLSALP